MIEKEKKVNNNKKERKKPYQKKIFKKKSISLNEIKGYSSATFQKF